MDGNDQNLTDMHGLYGVPPDDLTAFSAPPVQFSPTMPGAGVLENQPPGSLTFLTMLAPPGTVERRYAMAMGLRALAPGGRYAIMAPRDRGGARLAAELEAFGCAPDDHARRHHRICEGIRPDHVTGLETATEAGCARLMPELGLWSQPGIFSWDRIDPGSALLIAHLPPLAGRGADFGGGIGVLSLAVLGAPKVIALSLIDIDRRAVEAARRNCTDPRITMRWADIRQPDPVLSKLDFVVMNPPFHEGGTEDRSLGQTFIRRAAESLRTGGRLWITANRHLPYEGVMKPLFKLVTPIAEASGYKIYEARK